MLNYDKVAVVAKKFLARAAGCKRRRSVGFNVFIDKSIKLWRLTLRHVSTESAELKLLCEKIAFVLNNKYK